MNIRLGLASALVASLFMGPITVAQQAEVATPPAKTAAPPAKVTPPAKAAAPASAEIVVADPTTTGGTPSGKQIYAKDRATAVGKCKNMCPFGGTLTPSIPPSDYWYCTCKGAVSD
jgi:hypothetical protein